MTDSSHTPNSLDPEAGIPQNPSGNPLHSAAQAAEDLRAAATEKAREIAGAASAQAAVLKERAVETAQHYREVATEKAAQFKDAATERAEALRHAAQERAQHLKESANEQWHGTCDRAKELQVTAEDYIRQNPAKAVLGALGVGFLIGLIVRR
jgi:ElaB/YqjD/DUF883 family membrane-anchored ribosome-binding protein